MSAEKRKHVTLTVEDKNTIIERLDRGESQNKLAEEYGVGRSTIYDIIKNREKIKTFLASADLRLSNRQTLRSAKNPEVEEALYLWFLQERQKHTFVTGPQLVEKAKFYYKKITGKNDFVASKGWLEGFKRRHGIRISEEKVAKEKPSLKINETLHIEEFKERFLLRVTELDLCPSQVYNAAESRLYWRIPSEKTIVPREEILVLSRKVNKERITFLSCANASGQHALKLLVIGKAHKPRTFRDIELPVYYFGQNNTVMIGELIKNWFDMCFVPDVRRWLKERNLPQKALLLLDDTHGLSEEELISEDKSITVMFIPHGATSIQPINQKIIHFVKHKYKKNMLTAISKTQCIQKTLGEFDMKDMVFLLTHSWSSLSACTISSGWKDLWPSLSAISQEPEEDMSQDTRTLLSDIASAVQMPIEELQAWYEGIDEQKIESECPSKKIIQSDSPIAGEDDRDPLNTVSSVSWEDAAKSFEICIQWAEENGFSSSEILLLRGLRDKAVMTQSQRLQKRELRDYIVPEICYE